MILITGGAGFIGSHTARAFGEAGFECVVTSRSPTSSGSARHRVEVLDMTSDADWAAIGERYSISGIVHLAASGIDRDAADQMAENLTGLLGAARFATNWGVKRMIVASTIGVYAGADTSAPLREDALLPPIGLHGIQASKKINEIAADLLARTNDLDIVSVRIPAVWGPRGHTSSRFFGLPQMVHAAVNGTPITVAVNDGIDQLYVKDVARAIVAIYQVNRLDHRIYNVGSGFLTTNRDVAMAILTAVPDARIRLEDNPDGATSSLDVSRLLAETAYRPNYNLERGVAEYVAWLREGHER